MDEDLIYFARDRISVSHDPGNGAVHCMFFRTFDEFGVFLPAAVRAGLDHATEHTIANWVVDVVDETDSMSERDSDWESSEEFLQLFRDSSIRNILLVVPATVGEEELSGAQAWATGFASQLGADFTGGAVAGRDDVAAYLDRTASSEPTSG